MTTDDLRAIRDEIGITPSTLDLAASMRRLIDALIDEREGTAPQPAGVCGDRLASITGKVLTCTLDSGHLGVHEDGTAMWGCVEPIPPDRRAILAEMTRDETAEGMRADGFPPAATSAGLGDVLRGLVPRAGHAAEDCCWTDERIRDLADRADALEAERDRLADERDTLRAALDQERRSMADRLTVLERIKGERDGYVKVADDLAARLDRAEAEGDEARAAVAAAQRWIGDHIREEREQGIDGAFIDGGCLRTLQRDMDEALSGDGGATAVEVDVVPDLGRFHERIAAVASYLGKSETALRSVYAEAIREDAAARRALAEAIDRWAQTPVTLRWALGESQPCDSGAGAEGSRTRETGVRSVFGGVPVPWHGSSLLGRSEGETGGRR